MQYEVVDPLSMMGDIKESKALAKIAANRKNAYQSMRRDTDEKW